MEKELNLLTLLKGCENETVYMPDEGDCKVTQVNDGSIEVFVKDADRPTNLAAETLEIKPTGFAYVYPSRESFLAHPLDARKAWEEWEESMKPKRWRAEKGKDYWYFSLCGEPEITSEEGCIEDDCHYDMGNYFRTESLAQQAAEAVRETLMKFHEQHPQI